MGAGTGAPASGPALWPEFCDSRRVGDRRSDGNANDIVTAPIRPQPAEGQLNLESASISAIVADGGASGEMADTPDLGSGPARGGGSSPLSRTMNYPCFPANDLSNWKRSPHRWPPA